MAKVYKRIKGEPLERIAARTEEAYKGTEDMARGFYSRARTILAQHRAYGGSEIDFQHPDFLTWEVGLTDKATAHDKSEAAPNFHGEYTIEYGHEARDGSWVDGPSPLRQALDDLGWGRDFGKKTTGRGKRD